MENIEKINAAQNAGQKPAILKPLIKLETNQNIKALITRVNNPKVKILIGKVKISISGRMIALTKPKTAEVISADQKLEKLTPGTI